MHDWLGRIAQQSPKVKRATWEQWLGFKWGKFPKRPLGNLRGIPHSMGQHGIPNICPVDFARYNPSPHLSRPWHNQSHTWIHNIFHLGGNRSHSYTKLNTPYGSWKGRVGTAHPWLKRERCELLQTPPSHHPSNRFSFSSKLVPLSVTWVIPPRPQPSLVGCGGMKCLTVSWDAVERELSLVFEAPK